MDLSYLFVFLLSLAAINSIIAAISIKSFLSRHTSIDNRETIEELKKVVRKQMYQSLLQMLLLIGGNIMGLAGLIKGTTSLLLIIIINGIIFILGKILKGDEDKVRDMEIQDITLKREYEDICDTWTRKAFPDF